MLVLWRRISKMMMVDQVQEQKTDGDLFLHGDHEDSQPLYRGGKQLSLVQFAMRVYLLLVLMQMEVKDGKKKTPYFCSCRGSGLRWGLGRRRSCLG